MLPDQTTGEAIAAPLMHTLDEVMALTRIGRTRLYELMATGELPSVRLGRRRLIRRSDLEAFIDGLVEADVA